jgi:hypothetical protein
VAEFINGLIKFNAVDDKLGLPLGNKYDIRSPLLVL